MANQLFRIGQTEFWVLADTIEEKILETYKRSQVEADIQAIQETLERYPDPDVMQEDLQALIWLVDTFEGAPQARKDRVKAMLQDMWQAYQNEPEMYQASELRARLENLQSLLAKMV